MKSTRGRLARLLLALLGVTVSLVLAEGLARLVAPAPGAVQFVPDAQLGYRHAPSQNVWVRDEHGEYAARFTTNAFGDPDRARSLEKPPGTYRIAVIGDSMVEAAQVAPEARFTSLLEEQLNDWMEAQGGPGRPVEVLNFGVAGYSTAQEWLLYRSHVRRFAPDLVVLVFLPGNDIKNNSYALEVERSCRPELAPFYRLTDDHKLVLANEQFYDLAAARYQEPERAWPRRLADELRLVALARRALDGARPAGLDQDDCQTAATLELYDPAVQAASADWQAAWQLTASILAQFAREAAEDGAAFHLVTVTGPWEVQPDTRDLVLAAADQGRYDWDMAQQMTAEMVTRLGLAHTPALPAMQQAAAAGQDPVHYRYNGHYTPAGHAVLAAELLPVLQTYLSEGTQGR